MKWLISKAACSYVSRSGGKHQISMRSAKALGVQSRLECLSIWSSTSGDEWLTGCRRGRRRSKEIDTWRGKAAQSGLRPTRSSAARQKRALEAVVIARARIRGRPRRHKNHAELDIRDRRVNVRTVSKVVELTAVGGLCFSRITLIKCNQVICFVEPRILSMAVVNGLGPERKGQNTWNCARSHVTSRATGCPKRMVGLARSNSDTSSFGEFVM
jgi:hypothetical protein